MTKIHCGLIKNKKDKKYNMYKKSIKFPLIYFIASIVWQLIANKEINWINNIGVCFVIFLIILLYNWSKSPYNWKKDNTE
ncbi:hypothetical protein CWR45_12125 [Oceanobacillus chungangensis]|uniref:Uncharacterized protein n=1 Tax=Oceanobacillus chungangensis TaxID=1229152 RepID=A0A3D8PMY9_9BACI|nr:hypothetical protein CWR45_12125 [Oceanobacillus chungangensis]